MRALILTLACITLVVESRRVQAAAKDRNAGLATLLFAPNALVRSLTRAQRNLFTRVRHRAPMGGEPSDNSDDKTKEYNTTPKNILLLGSTGGMGSHVLVEALARGHNVCAVARTPSKVKVPQHITDKNQLTLVQGDVTDLESIKKALNTSGRGREVDVIVSCVGAGMGDRGSKVMSTMVENLKAAIDDSNANGPGNDFKKPRLIMMSSLGCGGSSTTVYYGLGAVIGFGSMADMDLADSMVLSEKQFSFPLTDKTVVCRPPRIDASKLPEKASDTDTSVSVKKYQATADFPTWSPIACGMSQEAVAQFIVDCVETETWDGKGVQIYAA